MGNTGSVQVKRQNRTIRTDSDEERHTRNIELSKKIRKKYPKKTDKEVKMLSELLVDPEKIKQEYFSHIVKKLDECKKDVAEDIGLLQANRLPRNKEVRERFTKNAKDAQGVYVKLLWFELERNPVVQTIAAKICPLQKCAFTYGPYHVALQVDDMMIEWNDSSLIIPVRAGSIDAVYAIKVGEPQAIPDLPVGPGTNAMYTSAAKEVECTVENKVELLKQLCELISLYNRKLHYKLFTNNCQHFAKDVLEHLGVGHDDAKELFHEKSKALAEIVNECSKAEQYAEFSCHEELDTFLMEKGETLEPKILRFCQLHYILFHDISAKRHEQKDWKCDKEGCQLARLEDRIKQTEQAEVELTA